MGNQLIRTFTNQKLVPMMDIGFSEKSRIVVNLPPSVVYPRGSLLLLDTSTGQNDVQTVAVTGSPTGGTYTLNVTSPLTGITAATGTIASTSSDSAVANAINALFAGGTSGVLGPGSVTVSSGAVTFGGALANLPIPPMTLGTNSLTGGTTPSVTVTHTTTGLTAGTYSQYPGSSGTVAAILEYDCATDSAGNVTMGSASGGGEHGETSRSASAYTRGYFNCADLVNLDANALSTAKAHLINGTVTAGVVYFP